MTDSVKARIFALMSTPNPNGESGWTVPEMMDALGATNTPEARRLMHGQVKALIRRGKIAHTKTHRNKAGIYEIASR